jgi:hypothetical protein
MLQNVLYDFLQKSVHAGIFLGGPQALQTTRYAHDASRIHISLFYWLPVVYELDYRHVS